jgi:ribulose-bisphosphate carboxylase small chain
MTGALTPPLGTRFRGIVNRPKDEPGFSLERTEGKGRTLTYTTRAYATERPEGKRYA